MLKLKIGFWVIIKVFVSANVSRMWHWQTNSCPIYVWQNLFGVREKQKKRKERLNKSQNVKVLFWFFLIKIYIPAIKICDHVFSCEAATVWNELQRCRLFKYIWRGIRVKSSSCKDMCSLWFSFYWIIIILSMPYVGITLWFSWLIARGVFFFIQISKSWTLIFSSIASQWNSALLPTLGSERICQHNVPVMIAQNLIQIASCWRYMQYLLCYELLSLCW